MTPKKSSSNDIYKDTFKLGSGTALGQALLILSAPLLGRIFSPETFGTYALFNSFLFVLSGITALRYEQAIVLPRLKKNGDYLLQISFSIGIVSSLFIGIILFIFRNQIGNLLDDTIFKNYMWLVGIGILLFSIYNGFNYWNTRNLKYKIISLGRVCFSVVLVSIQVTSGLLGYNSAGFLIAGVLFGKITENIILIKSAALSFPLFKTTSQKRYYALLKKYKKFPQYNTWATLINTLSWQIPTFLLFAFFDKSIVGFYSMGDRVIRLPMSILGKAVSQVFFQKGTVAHQSNELNQVYRQSLRMLSNLALIPSIILTFAGKDIFIIFLGSKWAEAGVYVQILSLWAFILFLASPLSSIINIVEKQEKNLLFNSLILISRIVAIVIGGVFHNTYLALGLFSISGIFSYGWLLFWTGLASGVTVKQSLSDMFFSNRYWLLGVTLVMALTSLLNINTWGVVIISTVTGLVYFASHRNKFLAVLRKE